MKFDWEGGWNQEVFDEPLYFEDFHPDLRFNSLPRAHVSSGDIINFGLATGDRNALHTNESFAKTSILGGIVAHGELVANSLFGALHFVGFWEKTLGALCEKYVKFILPVRPGDRVKHFLHVIETKEIKNHSDYGFVKFEFFTQNQRYERVAEGWFSVVIRKKNTKK
ncbi:MAG: MaoC/PaaZ C-terminal domain-containing protein [bacterium]|nr:MaoC/PaaZ C-terminal domain-containing protein [bacterium]